LKITGFQEISRIGENSEISPKRLNMHFFNVKIQEIMAKRGGFWELINWIKK